MSESAESFRIAVRHHAEGRVAEAERIYREILAAEPANARVLQLLGIAAEQQGRLAEANDLLRRALGIQPNNADAHADLGRVLRRLGQPVEAATSLQQALRLQPRHVSAAIELGAIFLSQRHAAEAEQCFRRAIESEPSNAAAHSNLTLSLLEQGKTAQAVEIGRRSVELNPHDSFAYNNLGCALMVSRPGDAEQAFRRAIELNPNSADAFGNLAALLANIGRLADAIPMHRRAVELRPSYAAFQFDLAATLLSAGDVNGAIELSRKGIELRPDVPAGAEILMAAMICQPRFTPAQVFAAHREWGQRYADPLAPVETRFDNLGVSDRILRVGYVSGDFREHSVSYFIEPILAAHDPQRVAVFCYNNTRSIDTVGRRLRDAYGATWRDIAVASDQRVLEMIREDGIDILVDLSGHTSGNRLLVFARRAAPVQVTWIGYPVTTGMSAMDYWITDPLIDPPGQTEPYATEQLVRLPDTFTCYRPPDDAPEILDPASRPFTFGSFNAAKKLNDEVLGLWAKVLAAIPDSRLLIKCPGALLESNRKRILEALAANSVGADRLELLDRTPKRTRHLELYHRVDLALDTFPYHGTTTTCEAAWMGVPVVTLAGPTHMSRVGVSLLGNLGLEGFVAKTSDEYIEIAKRAAGDDARMRELRRTMRDRMKNSALLDQKRFTRNLENAYYQVFREKTESYRGTERSC